jgi:hypothetical protein
VLLERLGGGAVKVVTVGNYYYYYYYYYYSSLRTGIFIAISCFSHTVAVVGALFVYDDETVYAIQFLVVL